MESQQERGLPVTRGKHVASIGGNTFEIKRISKQSLDVGGREVQFDWKPLDNGSFSLILNGISHVVEHIAAEKPAHDERNDTEGLAGKTICVSIQGKAYSVLVDDDRSILFKQFVTKAHAGSGAHVIRAPMPGLISRIEIKIGEEVTKGRGLVVLEAMKMENEIRANQAGRVKTIHVEKGKPVDKDEPLITIEEL
jgi:biotin carboxyl carrier protein